MLDLMMGGYALFVLVGIIFVGFWISAIILRSIANRLLHVELTIGHACLLVFATGFVNILMTYCSLLLLGRTFDNPQVVQLMGDLISFPFAFPANAAIYAYGIENKYPDTGKPIGFLKGFKVAAIMYMIHLAFTFLFMLINFVMSRAAET